MSLVYQHDTRPVIKLRKQGTRKTFTVYVTKETDTLYVGDAIGDIVCDHRAFVKEHYEVVNDQPRSAQVKEEWLIPIGIACMIFAVVGLVVNILAR